MLKDEYVSSIARFFYFALMNDKFAMQAAERVVTYLKNRVREDRVPDADIREELIRACAKYFYKYMSSPPRLRVGFVQFENAFHPPKGVSLTAWTRFLKQASPEETLSFILVTLLKFNETEVAQALHINSGTIRYRVSKSYQLLADNLAVSG